MIDSRTEPCSATDGIVWPGLPPVGDSLVLALLVQFERSQWWPPATLLRHQLRQLRALVDHAAATVPFYRERLRGVAGGALSLAAFRRIPVLTRREVQDSAEALTSTALPKDHGVAADTQSSGSTGRPVRVRITSIAELYTRALNMRYQMWHGRDFKGKIAAITALLGQVAVDAARTGAGLPWATGFRSGPMVYFDVNRPVPEQLDWLRREDPDYLLTYPTNLRALLEAARADGVRPARLRDASVMAEIVDPGLPALCREVWDMPVSATYSAREVGFIAMQCRERAGYHVQAESVLVEVLGDDGAPCAPGRAGRVVVTDLHNFAMPLIRYELGDFAEVGDGCPCGRTLPVLTQIMGRARNMFVLPQGGRIWPVAFETAAVAAIAPIRQIQFVQRSVTDIDVRLVAARALDADAEAKLRRHFAETLDHSFRFNLVYVDEIPRSPGGKYEDYISEVVA